MSLQALTGRRNKIVTPAEAVRLIHDGDTVATGGFISISQNAKKVIFVGTFTAQRLAVAVSDGHLKIIKEGALKKFVAVVEQLTFSGKYAFKRGQSVLYVTERCVFRLVESGLELLEIAPGIDLERDIFAHMDFRPAISPTLKTMDARLFRKAPMGSRDDMLAAPLLTTTTRNPSP